MEYKVPQNIDIEDRIVGPLTLRQFIILLCGAGIAFLFYLIFQGPATPIFYLLTILVGALAMALAFVDYGGRHLEKIVFDAIVSQTKPKKMIWKRDSSEINEQVKAYQASQKIEKIEVPQVVPKEDFQSVKAKLRAATANNDSQMQNIEMPGTVDELSKENPFLDKVITEKTAETKREEPLISQMTTVKPNQKFEYPKIETDNRKFL